MVLAADTIKARSLMLEGESSLRDKDLRGAGRSFRAALRLDAGLWQARLHLADIAVRSGDMAAAEPLLERVLSVQPLISHPYYLKAQVLARRGERGPAINCLKTALKISTEYEDARKLLFVLTNQLDPGADGVETPDYWNLVLEAGRTGDREKTRSALKNYADFPGERSVENLFKAYCLLSEYGKACELLSRLSKSAGMRERLNLTVIAEPWQLEPNGPRTLTGAALSGHASRLNKMRPRRGHEGFAAYLKATLALHVYGWQDAAALAVLRELKKEKSGRYDFVRQLTGQQSLCEGQPASVIADYRALIASGYRGWNTHCSLGEALICGGEVSLGLKEFANARAAAAPREKAGVIAWEGEMRLFLKQYRRVVELLKPSKHIYSGVWLGAAYLQLGKNKEALEELKRAVAARPHEAEARIWLGEAFRRCGLRREAARELDLAHKLAGRSVWVYLNRALLANESGDAAGMSRYFSLAVVEWPEIFPVMRKRLGIGGEAAMPGPVMARLITQTLKACGGYRRTDRCFQPLLLLSCSAG